MKKRLVLLFTAICLLFNGCVSIVEPIVATDTEQPITATEIAKVDTNTPTSPKETATPTLVPTITNTPLPTIDKRPPTPTVERPVESDINPFYEKKIDTEWKGVRIKASIQIDESLQDRVVSIEMMDSLLAEIVARTIFAAWYSQNSQDFWETYYTRDINNQWMISFDDIALDSFMELWSKAQKTGDASDWRKVQINYIWANDLNDGNGYVPKPYNFWPMYEGEVPSNVTSIKEFIYVLSNANASNNLTKLKYPDAANSHPSVQTGFGKNISKDVFLYNIGGHYNIKSLDAGTSISMAESIFEESTAQYFSYSEYLFIFHNGEKYIEPWTRTFYLDENMYKSIIHWGIKIRLTSE